MAPLAMCYAWAKPRAAMCYAWLRRDKDAGPAIAAAALTQEPTAEGASPQPRADDARGFQDTNGFGIPTTEVQDAEPDLELVERQIGALERLIGAQQEELGALRGLVKRARSRSRSPDTPSPDRHTSSPDREDPYRSLPVRGSGRPPPRAESRIPGAQIARPRSASARPRRAPTSPPRDARWRTDGRLPATLSPPSTGPSSPAPTATHGSPCDGALFDGVLPLVAGTPPPSPEAVARARAASERLFRGRRSLAPSPAVSWLQHHTGRSAFECRTALKASQGAGTRETNGQRVATGGTPPNTFGCHHKVN